MKRRQRAHLSNHCRPSGLRELTAELPARSTVLEKDCLVAVARGSDARGTRTLAILCICVVQSGVQRLRGGSRRGRRQLIVDAQEVRHGLVERVVVQIVHIDLRRRACRHARRRLLLRGSVQAQEVSHSLVVVGGLRMRMSGGSFGAVLRSGGWSQEACHILFVIGGRLRASGHNFGAIFRGRSWSFFAGAGAWSLSC
jgi:hypothetical protein